MYEVCIEAGNVNGPVFSLYITEEAFNQTELSVNFSPNDFYLYYFIFLCFLIFFKEVPGLLLFFVVGYLYARLFICGYLCARLFICKCFCFYNGDNNSPCRLEIIEIMLPAAQEGV